MMVGKSFVIWVVVLVALPVLLLSPSQKSTWTEGQPTDSLKREIEDAYGRRVVLNAQPKRIVTVFASNTELVYALGLDKYVVGIDAGTNHPPEIANRAARIGGGMGISLEQIVAQNPDLVIMTPAHQAIHTLLGPLEKMGIPAVVLTSRSVDEIMDNLEKLGTLTGRLETGQAVVRDMKFRLARVHQRQLGRTKPKVVLIISRLPSGLFVVVRKGDYRANMVELAGGVLALESDLDILPSMPQISPEALMSVDPDIILFRRRAGEGNELEEYLRRSAFSTLKAYRSGHIYALIGPEFGTPSVRVVDGVERMADTFDKWHKQQ